jgi:hypothetical protein
MSTHVRWIVVVTLFLVLGVGALYWFNTNVTGVSIEKTDGRRTWVIEPGDTVKLAADEVRRDDRYRCEGIAATVRGTPLPGRMVATSPGGAPEGVGLGVITVETAADGDVTVDCEPDAALP